MAHRRIVRQELCTPLVANLENWMREQRPKLSRGTDLVRAIDYMLKRWTSFSRFLDVDRASSVQRVIKSALDKKGVSLSMVLPRRKRAV